MPEQAGIFIGSLATAGYILPIVGTLEVVVGILLITNKYVTLSLVVIFPIIINAFLFHLFLDLAGIIGAFIAISLNITFFMMYRENYKNMLQMNTVSA